MAGLISRRYAEALFRLAVEKDCVDKYDSQVRLVREALSCDSEVIRVINNPQISSDVKLKILISAFKDSADDDILGLLSVVFRKNRESELTDILDTFLSKVRDYKGFITAEVESAAALDDKRLEQIKNKLSDKLNKQVEIEAKVVPELIGGLKITVSGQVIDSSIKSQIDSMKKVLNEIQLAQ